ncbi:MAG: nucleotidyltransferase family protein [Dehalococcoidia bacterium]|nr:nucleotidyltransferase family protein [Dehalococcoidia bacterium]
MENRPFFVSAVLLAAGRAKRMGRPKLLMPFRDSTILEQAIDNLLGSRVDELIVVLGDDTRELAGRIRGRRLTIVENPEAERGMSTSIVAGLRVVHRSATALMIALADQPLVDRKVVDRLIAEFQRGGKDIVVPTFKGARGNPVIFSVKYREDQLKLTGDVGGRTIIEGHPDDVLEVPVGAEGVSVDIDTPEDYARLAGKENA